MKSYLRLIPHATPGVLRTRRRSQRERCANDDEEQGAAHGLRFIWVCCPMCEGWRPVMNVERLGEQKR